MNLSQILSVLIVILGVAIFVLYTFLNNLNTENTKYKKDINDMETYYNNLALKNLELKDKVKNDSKFTNYAGCISNIYGLEFYKVFKGDDGGANSTRTYYCSPYYTNGSANDNTKDYRKPAFK